MSARRRHVDRGPLGGRHLEDPDEVGGHHEGAGPPSVLDLFEPVRGPRTARSPPRAHRRTASRAPSPDVRRGTRARSSRRCRRASIAQSATWASMPARPPRVVAERPRGRPPWASRWCPTCRREARGPSGCRPPEAGAPMRPPPRSRHRLATAATGYSAREAVSSSSRPTWPTATATSASRRMYASSPARRCQFTGR